MGPPVILRMESRHALAAQRMQREAPNSRMLARRRAARQSNCCGFGARRGGMAAYNLARTLMRWPIYAESLFFVDAGDRDRKRVRGFAAGSGAGEFRRASEWIWRSGRVRSDITGASPSPGIGKSICACV